MGKRWEYKLPFRDLLMNENVSAERAKEIGKAFSNRPSIFIKSHSDFHYTELEEITGAFTDVEDQDDFNNVLSWLWDFCDANRIWVPFEGERIPAGYIDVTESARSEGGDDANPD